MRDNNEFPKAISEYIIKTKPENISNDTFIMLGELYASNKINEVIYLYCNIYICF